MPLTREQFDGLRAKGLSVEQIVAFERGQTPTTMPQSQVPEEEPGFLRSAISDPVKTLIAKPAVRFSQALASGAGALIGGETGRKLQEEANKPSKLPFGLGTVEPQKAFGEGGGKQIVGDIAKTASYLYTGGSGAAAAGSGLRGELIAGAVQGLKAGTVGGGAYSFGDAIQEAENQPADIAMKTLFGAGIGAATGVTLGAGLPLVVKGINLKKSLSSLESLEKSLESQNKNIFQPTATDMGEWSRAKVDPIKTFTKEFGPEAIPTSGNKLQLDNFIADVDARYKAGAEGFNTILRNSPEAVSLAQREAQALAEIEATTLKPTLKQQAREKIGREFAAIREEAERSGNLFNDRVRVAYADNLKDGFWGATKNFGSEQSTIDNTVNKAIGRSFKEGIESVVEDVNVKSFNKKLQELIMLKDFLESRNGKVPGSGGKMARYVARIVGGTAGSGGGPLGSVLGSITADKVAQAMIDPASQTWLLRLQLQKLSPEARATLQNEAEQIILKMAERRKGTLQLPAPRQVNLPARSQSRVAEDVARSGPFVGEPAIGKGEYVGFSEIGSTGAMPTPLKQSITPVGGLPIGERVIVQGSENLGPAVIVKEGKGTITVQFANGKRATLKNSANVSIDSEVISFKERPKK